MGIGDWGLGIGPNPQSPHNNFRISLMKLYYIYIYMFVKFYIYSIG